MSEQSIEQAYARYCSKVRDGMTQEQFRRLYEEENLALGGTKRMEAISARRLYRCPFDILEDADALDRSYRSAIDRLFAASVAHAVAAGADQAHYTLGAESQGGIPLETLYRALARHFSKGILREHWTTLAMLIRPLPDGKPDINAWRRYLFPLVPQCNQALRELENAMEAICKEYGRREEMAERQQELDRKIAASQGQPAK